MHKTVFTRLPAIACAAGICAAGVGLAAGAFAQILAPSEITARENAEGVRLIRRYRSWTKVNPKPFQMQPAAAAACAPALPAQHPSPHLKKYVTVYVNEPGKQAMTAQKSPVFPVGSVIVKEKLAAPTDKSPELMTVMVKREKGFNPDCGDWEFLVFDGAGKKLTAKGTLETCGSCHKSDPASKSDFVFRSYYLPQEKLAALK